MTVHVEECASVEFEENRWDVRIKCKDKDGEVVAEFVASADAWFTDGSGVYFDTKAEWEATRDER